MIVTNQMRSVSGARLLAATCVALPLVLWFGFVALCVRDFGASLLSVSCLWCRLIMHEVFWCGSQRREDRATLSLRGCLGLHSTFDEARLYPTSIVSCSGACVFVFTFEARRAAVFFFPLRVVSRIHNRALFCQWIVLIYAS